jgi:hypothetical protein
MVTAEQARGILIDRFKRALDAGVALDHDLDKQALLVEVLIGLATEVETLKKKVQSLEAAQGNARG